MQKMIALFGAVLILAAPALADEGCSKDTDCNGGRVCLDRICVEPSVRPLRESAATADPGLQPLPADSTEAVPAKYAPPPAPVRGSGNAGLESSRAMLLDTRHRHLGLFIRPDVGFGYFTSSASQNGVDAGMSGFAGTAGFAIGGALAEDSILALHLWDAAVHDPNVSIGNLSGTANGDVDVFAIGPEYTHYTKDNFYFSISPSLSRLHVSSGSSSADTNWGFGLRGAFGKEWWVSDHWGLGVVGHVSWSINQDSGSNAPTWTTWAFTVAFSATYN